MTELVVRLALSFRPDSVDPIEQNPRNIADILRILRLRIGRRWPEAEMRNEQLILSRVLSEGLEQTTRAALAVEAYRREKLSLGQVAQMLDLTTDEADGLLKDHGVLLDMTLSEVRQDVASLRELIRR